MTVDVSVLIASHRPPLLPFALESAWAQHGVGLQVLVNFSRDPRNFLTAWNTLADIASGRYFCILGDDDTLGTGYLEAAIKTLDATGADIAYSDVRCAYRAPDGREKPVGGLYVPPPSIGLAEMAQGNRIWQSSVVRAEAWRRVGGYDMALEYVHDWDFWVRVLQTGGKAVYMPNVYWTHFTHDGDRVTTSSNRERAFEAFWHKHGDLARFRESQ